MSLKLYICNFGFRKTFVISQRCDTQNLDCKLRSLKFIKIFFTKSDTILFKLAIQKGNVCGKHV